MTSQCPIHVIPYWRMSHGQQYYLKALWIRLALTDQRAHGYVEQNFSRKKIILEIKLILDWAFSITKDSFQHMNVSLIFDYLQTPKHKQIQRKVVATPFRSLDQVVMSNTLGMMLQPN